MRDIRLVVLLSAVITLFGIATGVSLAVSLAAAVIVGLQWWSGAWIWGRVRKEAPVWERLGIGLALGTSLATFSGLIVTAVFGTAWGWALVPMITVVAAALLRKGHMAPSPETAFDKASVMAIAMGLLVGIGALAWAVRSYPLGTGQWTRFHPDMVFFEALGNSLSNFGPLESIFTPDSAIRYHWLVYAWAGQIQESLGAEPFTVLTRVLPVVALIGAILVSVAWTRELTKQRWAPTLSVLLLVVGGFVGAAYGTVLNFDSPSLALTTMALTACVWIAGRLAIRGSVSPRSAVMQLIALGVLAAMVSGGKVSSAAVAVAAVGLLWVVSWGNPSLDRRRAGLGFLAITAGSVIAFVAVAAGSADPGGLRIGDLLDRSSSVQGLNPFPGAMGIILGTTLLALAVVYRGVGVLWLLSYRDERSAPWTWLGVGLLIASVGPILLISGGFNEVWFAVAAAGPLSVISAYGVVRAVETVSPPKSTLSFAFAAVGSLAVSAVVVALWTTGPSGGNVWMSTLRWAAPLAGLAGATVVAAVLAVRRRCSLSWVGGFQAWLIVVIVLVSLSGRLLTLVGPLGTQPGMRSDMFSPSIRFVESIDRSNPPSDGSGLLTAGRWLAENSNRDDLVVTNLTLWPGVAAATSRQTLASNIWYQAPYGAASMIEPLLERERLSWRFIDSPDQLSASALCAYPVRWVLVDTDLTSERDWGPWATPAFNSGSITLLEWKPNACYGGASS